MQIKCSHCTKMFAENRDAALAGLFAIHNEGQNHYDALCPHCQKAVRVSDERMNETGLLRLMVSDPLVMNLSNTLGYLRGEMGQEKVEKKSSSIWQFAPIKKILLAIYNWIFKRYYG